MIKKEVFIKRIEKYFKYNKNGSQAAGLKKLFYDNKKHNYFLSNAYGLIRLNTNNLNDLQKIEYIKEVYDVQTSEENNTAASLARFNDNFNAGGFCKYQFNFKNIKDEDIIKEDNKKYIKINGVLFNYDYIKNIKTVLNDKDLSIFTSESDDYTIKNTICLTGSSGYAYLLGTRSF